MVHCAAALWQPQPVLTTAVAPTLPPLCSEGGIWATLFGLLLWDVLFMAVPDVFRTPFQVPAAAQCWAVVACRAQHPRCLPSV